MAVYILRRVLVFIPTLFAISLIAFIISINAPGDPVENYFEGSKNGKSGSLQSSKIAAQKDSFRHELGLDLPVFYVTMGSLAEPDTFYRIGNIAERENLERLIDCYGNWEFISQWYQDLKWLKIAAGKKIEPDSAMLAVHTADSIRYNTDFFYQKVLSLFLTHDPVETESKLAQLQQMITNAGKAGQNYLLHTQSALETCMASFEAVKEQATPWKTYVPSLNFYGYNQYHRWVFGDGNMFTGNNARFTSGIIRGDFGKSYITGTSVTDTIARALPWSVFFTLISVLLAYVISIPIGVQAASKRGSLFDRGSSVVLFMLYSLPTFLMGTLLLMTFANPDAFNVFPANGVMPAKGYPDDAGMWDKFLISWPYFVLPLICYTYSSLAFLSRTMRVAMLEVSSLDFMRTAQAKGLTRYLIHYKHGLRNALLPIITVFSNVFPLAVGGSVILEYLFGIPGMGPEILSAVTTKDFQMIVAVFTLSGFMTLIGYLIADILYAVADPRISFSKK